MFRMPQPYTPQDYCLLSITIFYYYTLYSLSVFSLAKSLQLILKTGQPTDQLFICSVDCTSGLDVATCGVANATRFYSLATNFSRLVARLAPRFFDLVLKFLIEFSTLILSCSRMKPMKSCSILLLATLFTC